MSLNRSPFLDKWAAWSCRFQGQLLVDRDGVRYPCRSASFRAISKCSTQFFVTPTENR